MGLGGQDFLDGSMKTQTRVRVRAKGNGRPDLLALRREPWG